MKQNDEAMLQISQAFDGNAGVSQRDRVRLRLAREFIQHKRINALEYARLEQEIADVQSKFEAEGKK